MVSDDSSNHCRICGSYKLNRFYHSRDLDSELSLIQIIQHDDSLNQLIRPCECRGEFAHVHRLCLANWIETTRHHNCDICGFKYNLTFINRSVIDWFHETQQAGPTLKRTYGALLIYYVSALGIIVCQTKIYKSILDIFILVSAYTWISVCTTFIAFYCYKALNEFRKWRCMNRRVFVAENKNPQLELKPRPKDVLKSSGFKPK